MTQTQLVQIELREALRKFQEHRRLVTLLRSMALELERLNEDNSQLRAAVQMYREVMRRTPQKSQRTRSTLLRKKPAAGASAAL